MAPLLLLLLLLFVGCDPSVVPNPQSADTPGDPGELKDASWNYRLVNHVAMLPDSAGQVTFDDASQNTLPTGFRPYRDFTEPLATHRWYWGKIQVVNKLAIFVGPMCYLAFIRFFIKPDDLLPGWGRYFRGLTWLGLPLMLLHWWVSYDSNFSFVLEDRISTPYIALVGQTVSFVSLSRSYCGSWQGAKTGVQP